jgi:hypothetical protein
MKTLPHPPIIPLRRLTGAFTLTETVIAIGVLAVLLTGFIAVFTPAAQGIRRSISSEQADRLTSTLEAELVTPRHGQPRNPSNVLTNQIQSTKAMTGFTKAFEWIDTGNAPTTAIFVYQYRGDLSRERRVDGTLVPRTNLKDSKPGVDYILQTMARRANDSLLDDDLKAIEGSVFFVKPTQLVFSAGELKLGTLGEIKNPDGSTVTDSAQYTEAVIAFTAEFHSVPSKTYEYLTGNGFKTRHARIIAANSPLKPVFTRNLAVRR